MTPARTLNFTHRQRRTFVSSLFALTFIACVVTVSASAVLPCPARTSRDRYADDGSEEVGQSKRRVTVIEKRPRRWIEETQPKPPQS
ncbi:hypothetical protein OBBRIDRAFT_795348 [Obba rivulosa]|uniref:Uncharacterized protein n=1 Tax=Obba rivulosa TaxID=1052685 RepID=A0A8E2DJX7_9APHY|nr:hypothetical protein OBBRIDRAFT_795348 [Obba rivulosa]